MKPDSKELSELLLALYDAAADTTLWPIFLRRLAYLSRSDVAGLLLHDLASQDHSIALYHGVSQEIVRLYAEYYGATDVWVKLAPLQAGSFCTSDQICSLSELSKTEFYTDLLQPFGIAYGMWGILQNADSRVLNVGVYRGPRDKPFSPSELDLLRLVAPHLKQAFSLHRLTTNLRSSNQQLQAALDMIATGIILLGRSGRIVMMNRSATLLLEDNDGLQARFSCLRLKSATESEHLQRLLSNAERTSLGGGAGPGGAMQVSRGHRAALHLIISPVRALPGAADLGATTVVFVSDPDKRLRTPARALEMLFGLTPAECRLVLLLCDGTSLRMVAETLTLSTNTLKSQLASIYRKTNTSRQAELVRIVSRILIAQA